MNDKIHHIGFNKKIICEPMKDMSVKTVLEGAGAVKVARIDNKVSLVTLKVLKEYATDRFTMTKDDLVYVRGSCYTQPWAKEVFRLEDGTEFILVPESAVEFFGKNDKNVLKYEPGLRADEADAFAIGLGR
jgi:hypothetical protein